MSHLTWKRAYDDGGEIALQERSLSTSWDELWTVLHYDPPASQPGWYGLMIDRPDLAPGQLHPTLFGTFATKFSAKRIGSSKAWTVTVSYRNGDPQGIDLPPVQRPAVITTTTESQDVPTFRKASGDPWINSAGDLIVGLVKKKTRIRFRVQKNLPAYPTWLLTYDDAVNSDTVILRGLSISAHYLLLSDPEIGNLERETVNGIDYLFYPTTFNLIYDPDTWITRVYNRGLYQINATEYPNGGNYGPCKDDEGEPVSEPAFLDATGKQLPFPVNPASIVMLEDWDHDLLAFSALPTS